MASPRAPWLSRLLLVAATLITAGAIIAYARTVVEGAGETLAGTYPATWRAADGTTGAAALPVPGTFASAGLPPEVEVTYTIPVTLRTREPGSAAVLLDRVRHAAEVRWDGVVVGQAGAFADGRLLQGHDESILATIPAALAQEGPHRLTVRLQGAWDDGAAVGNVIVGSLPSLVRVQQWKEQERLSLAVVAVFLGLVHLSLSVRRPNRRDHRWFGLFLVAFAVYIFADSDSWFTAFGATADLEVRVRLRRGVLLLGLAAFVSVVAGLTDQRRDRAGVAIAVGFAASGIVALFSPWMTGNTWANRVGDLLILVFGAWMLVGVLRTVRRGAPGSIALLCALAAGLLGGVLDVLVTRGSLGSSYVMLPSMLALWGTVGAALSIRELDAQDRFEALYTQAADGVLLVDPSGVVVGANEAAEALLGGPMVGLALHDRVASVDVERCLAHLMRAARRPDRVDLALAGEPARFVESAATRLPDGTRLVLVRDLTTRRKVEEGLVRAARMESVGQLAGGLAHDFNNVLGGVLGQLTLVRARVRDDVETDASLERLERSLERATGLCRRLMTLARGGSPVRRRLAPRVLVEGALDLIRAAVEPAVRVAVEVPPDLPEVAGVASELEEVLVNLVMNARDASPHGATVRVSARRVGAGVELAVEDEGPGVPHEERPRIFEPFYTTKSVGTGTGLGLAVVERVVRDHGGQVRVEDGVGPDGGARGARFVVVLPGVAPGEDAERAPGAERIDEVACRVLVVDDEALVRDAVVAMLRADGHDVRAAGSAEEVLAEPAWMTAADVLVTDVLMPGVTGLELAERAVALHPGLRVVLMSGFLPEGPSWPRVADGAWDVLEKPFRVDQLRRVVARARQRTTSAGTAA